ncbi:MAG: hypothetical protein JW883_01940 [Deltaproteobacteria bacterium]|nr:hypothetical protein [Deltaproteobacteria bacterium]
MKEKTCQEETEQAQEVRAPEQAEEWVKALGVAEKAAALQQAPGETAFAPAVAKNLPISLEVLALNKSAPSAARQ